MPLLQAELARNWRIKATVFYDRPPAHFRPATLAEKVCRLLHRCSLSLPPLLPRSCIVLGYGIVKLINVCLKA